MLRQLPRRLAVGLGVLSMAACDAGEPTQPDVGTEAVPQAPLAALTSNTWVSRAAYPFVFGAVGLAAGVIPNAQGQSIVYTLGGTDGEGGSGVSIGRYNVATNTWSSKSYEPRIYVFNSNGVGRIGDKLYISGGYVWGPDGKTIVRHLWAYDPAANTLSQLPDMPKFTADGVTGVIDGKLYVLPATCATDFFPSSGYCDHLEFRRLFRYNPATNRWVTKAQAPHYHASGAGGVINGKFYVAGGLANALSETRPVTALDVYDPATDTWKTLAPLPIGGRARGAVLQGRLYVVIDRLRPDLTTELHTYVYNPATNVWSTRAAPNREHPSIVRVTLDGSPRLLAIGGIHYTPSPIVNASELYTP
jgi:hypothetical protein